MGIVGIHIHGLKDLNGQVSRKGSNPFDFITYGQSGNKLSSIVKCYDPPRNDSKDQYAWIAEYIAAAVEEAINIRSRA